MDEPKSRLISNKDNAKIERAIPAKGSKISSDGFFKKDSTNITMPKDIDPNTPDGNKKAGEFVKNVKTAIDRGKKMMYNSEQTTKANSTAKVGAGSKEYKEGWNYIFGPKT